MSSLLAFHIHRGHYLTFLPGASVQCSEHQSRLPEMIVSEAREYQFSSSGHCLGGCTTELPFQVLLLDRSEALLPQPRELKSKYDTCSSENLSPCKQSTFLLCTCNHSMPCRKCSVVRKPLLKMSILVWCAPVIFSIP